MESMDERPASRDSNWSFDVEDFGDVVYVAPPIITLPADHLCIGL